jgi:site-specific recombinase XerD
VALTHGMSIDSVAKMLGHSNTDMTRHYARVLDAKVSSEMNQLRAVFDKKAS